jgi:uncharacterized protein HemX
MKRLNQTGSHILGIALLIVALGVVGFAGYTVMNKNKDKTATATTATTQSDTIQNTADLTAASDQLDSSSTQVNSNLDDSSLNNDLNDLL